KQHQLNGARTGEALELEDLAFAGIGEFARQWLLVSRRAPYAAGGPHRVWVPGRGRARPGGAVGRGRGGGGVGGDLRRRPPRRPAWGGRRWQVQVRRADEARAEDAAWKAEGRRAAGDAALAQTREAVVKFLLRRPEGETARAIADGMLGGRKALVPAALEALE